MTDSSAGARAGRSSTMVLLEEGLAKLGIDEAAMDSAVTLLVRYIEEIELFNPAYGLVKVRDRRELIVKHILDSLAPLNIIRRLVGTPAKAGTEMPAIADVGSGAGLQGKPRAWQIADVGSGAGLPGIPLAICMPDAEFTLIERMGRRAGFLQNTVAVLGLSNVRVEEKEMEKIVPASRFDLVVFRAFRPLEPAILKGLLRLLSAGGIIAAYKGRRKTLEEEIAKFKMPGSEILSWEIHPLEVPFLEEERHLLLIRPEFGKKADT